jgi:hypothetical protein
VCLFVYYTCLLFVYFGCAGSVGIFWRAGSYIFCACVSSLCGVPGRYNFIQALSWSGWRDCTDFSFFSGSVVAGTVRLNGEGGGLSFFTLSSVCCQFSWWLDVRGRIMCSIN